MYIALMTNCPRLLTELFVSASIALTASTGWALQMVEGGFARNQDIGTPAPLTLNTPGLSGSVLNEMGFTPRHRSFAGLSEAGGPSFQLSVDPNYGGGLSFDPPSGFGSTDRSSVRQMMVGGALELEEVGLLGGVARTQLFGRQTDMLMAGMSYGGLRARLALGETATEVQGARDVMMLSTDLRLNRWMSLQGDLAVSERNDQQESLAVGRVGLRLRF